MNNFISFSCRSLIKRHFIRSNNLRAEEKCNCGMVDCRSVAKKVFFRVRMLVLGAANKQQTTKLTSSKEVSFVLTACERRRVVTHFHMHQTNRKSSNVLTNLKICFCLSLRNKLLKGFLDIFRRRRKPRTHKIECFDGDNDERKNFKFSFVCLGMSQRLGLYY